MQYPSLIIPALNPNAQLSRLVNVLRQTIPELSIIVVNDGSLEAAHPIFREVISMGAEVLHHSTRGGKGKALKTGFQHYLEQHKSDSPGVVTAHASGEHPPESVLQMIRMFAEYSEAFILGTRDLNTLPKKNRLGNQLFRWLFKIAVGYPAQDPFTGLRAYPRENMAELMFLPGNHYDFELQVMLHACRHHWRYLEVPLPSNAALGAEASHFDSIDDSMKLYFSFLRYVFQGANR